jgi:HSP20 family protein
MEVRTMQSQELQHTNGRQEVATTSNAAVFTPATDVIETADSYEVTVNMPGVREQEMEATLENDLLTIRGHAETVQYPNMRLAYQEYDSGDYRRVFTLTDKIDREHISATVKDGVLRVVLPKSEGGKAKKIAIKAA